MKDTDYIVIQAPMAKELKLSGNNLIIFALIHGFTKDGKHLFCGSLDYICKWTNLSKPAVISNLKQLIQLGLINKYEELKNGVKFCSYSTNYNVNLTTGLKTLPVVKKLKRGSKESLMGGSKESSPNNNSIDNTIDNKETSTKVEEKKDKLSLASPSSINFEKLMDYFNTHFEGKLPSILSINEKRKKAIKARAAEYGKEAVFSVLKKVEASAFLLGKNDENWRCDFDWIFRPTNFTKILEGNYDNKSNSDSAKGRKQSVKNLADLAEAILQGTATKVD